MIAVRIAILFFISFLTFTFFSHSSGSDIHVVGQSGKGVISSDQGLSTVQLVHKSRECTGANDLDAALDYARKAVAVDPAYYDAWKQLGRVLMLRGNYSEALTSFQTVLDLKTDETEVQIWILHCLLAQNRTSEMIQRLESLRATNIKLNNKLIADLLEMLFDQSDFNQAEKVAAFLSGKSPQPGTKIAVAALLQIIKGNLEDAEHILTAVDTTSEDSRPLMILAWTRLGVQLLSNNEALKSVTALQKALEFKPDRVPTLRELGWAYRRSGQPAKAAEVWNRGFQKDSRLLGWLLWIAEAYVEAGQLESALKALDLFLNSEPENNRGRALKLMVLLLCNDKRSVQLYEEKLKGQSNGSLIISLGHIFADRQAGRFAEAALHLESLFRLNPKNTDIRELLADVYALWAARATAKEAISPLQKLIALEPNRSGAWRDLGWSLWSNGQHDEALDAWEHAVIGDVPNRERLIKQVVARLAEENYSAKAIELYQRWNPGAPFLALGLTLSKENRYIAAREMLSAAFEAGETPLISGLYLAYAEARTGVCAKVIDHLSPFLEQGITSADQTEIETILSAVYNCSFEPNILPLAIKLETLIGVLPAYTARIIDILEKAATERKDMYDYENALHLYKLVLKHDPDRTKIWVQTGKVADELGRHQEAIALLKDILARTSSKAVREGIQGRLSDEYGDKDSAVTSYRSSLTAEPNQPDLRLFLFKDLISLQRFEEARNETEWFIEHSTSGVSDDLAVMYSNLGETSKAFEIWQQLYLTYPESPTYAIETARTLFTLCRAEEALSILEKLVSIRPHFRAYELLAEIEVSLGRPARALEWTRAGLALRSTKGLLHARSEAAEAAGESATAQEAAESLLTLDPGNVLISRIAGQAMLDQDLLDDSKGYYEALLKRNSSFLPSLANLRNLNSWEQKTKQALYYARQLFNQRPWDINAQENYAISLAEANKFRPALEILRAQASLSITKAIPVLIYNNVIDCPYPGRNTTKQIISHLERLAAEGYTFITPEEIDKIKEQPCVIIVVVNTEEPAFQILDTALQRIGGRAVYACATGTLTTQTPNAPSPEMLSKLMASGRWIIASSGPLENKRIAVDNSGTLGNPFTHRIMTARGKEDYTAMSERLDKLINAAALSLRPASTRIFFYPGGDYGQLSLDTEPQDLETLRSVVQKYFTFAIGSDENGFVAPGYDPLRLPGRLIPSGWDTDDLSNHLTRKNPLVRARAELAKTLYIQGQAERANEWFRQAETVGCDPVEINLNWGTNAYYEGDLPTALGKLRKAYELDPSSLKITKALERAENRKLPHVEIFTDRWSDSDDRDYSLWEGNVRGHVNDKLRLDMFTDRIRWARKGLGNEKSTRIGGGLQWYFAEEHWLDAKLWYENVNTITDHAGGHVTVHLPNAPLGGFVELQVLRDDIDTVEAVRKRISENDYTIYTYSRIRDMWDLFANFTFTHHTDSVDTYTVNGRFVRRLREWPFWGIGYAFRYADSSRKPLEYWVPEGLQQHQLYLTTRGEYYRFHYSLSGQWGEAEDDNSNWRFVWGGRFELDYQVSSGLTLNSRLTYQETPNYDSFQWSVGITYRF
ncbi:MAG: tetratricopeptide repeat protein [Proteobacteria bacterium]|nr:tetratricopeptide repeat protein [Pseudomonadota bacterium]